MTLPHQPIQILLVEDNEIDVLAFQRGMAKHRISNSLTVARNGREAIGILNGDPGSQPLGRPCVVFLDLNMPVMNGLEFLDEVAKRPELAVGPIYVLTTSDFDEDRLDTYQDQVSGFIVKRELADACLVLLESPQNYSRIVETRSPAT